MNKKRKKNNASLITIPNKQKRKINVLDLDIEDRLKYERLKMEFERYGFGGIFELFWVDIVKPKIKDFDNDVEGF